MAPFGAGKWEGVASSAGVWVAENRSEKLCGDGVVGLLWKLELRVGERLERRMLGR